MLSCDICGEQLLLEEDMKTHLLLSHVESEPSCPLCCLSGVSFDELSHHIGTAHPEKHGACESNCGSSDSSVSSGTKGDAQYGQYRGTSASSEHITACNRDGVSLFSSSTVDHQQSSDVISRNPLPQTSPWLSSPRRTADIDGATTSSVWTTSSLSIKPRESVGQCEGSDADLGRITPKPTRAKHQRLSSPVKENTFSCPMCELVCGSSVILQEHVELHLQEQSPAKAGGSECPMCPAVCRDSASLQQHVWLHLDNTATGNAGSPGADQRLARQLQWEEDERRKQEETKREAEEFKILQRRYGVDGSGGYRRQLERTLEKEVSRGLLAPADFHSKRAEMMEALATGVDDGSTRTQGVLEALYNYYQTEAKDCIHVWLSAETDHYCSSSGDKGWGCGYRNFQMLLSSLHKTDTFAECLPPDKAVPSIPRIQAMIEGAWEGGLDPQGASHFNRRLQGTRAWIGATEMYSLLTFLGIRARIVDFHKPTGPGSTHPRLFEWVKQYFSQSSGTSRLPPRVVRTCRPPLYLQHQGHSRTVVGVAEKDKGRLCLLVLDPGCSAADARKLPHADAIRQLAKLPSHLKHTQYQVVAAGGVLSAEEKQIRILDSSVLRAERIP